MVIFFSLAVALIGLLMFALCANAKLARIGEILLFCGTLAFLMESAPVLVGGTSSHVLVK